MIRRKLASLSMVFAAVALLCGSAQAFAATTTATPTTQGSGNALKVSPVRSDAEIKPGDSKVFDVYVQNLSSSSASLQAIVNDFIANKDESGTPSIILNSNQAAPTHSLKQFVAPIASFTLQPNEQKDIKVSVTIPKNAAPGGYYGAVRFAPAAASGDQSVTLSASVGSLILVKVPGNIKENVSVASFDIRKNDVSQTLFTSGKNLEAVVRFQNNGDVQEEPFGKVLVRKGGQTVSTREINDSSPRGNVLPSSIRRFSVGLDKIGSFGKYTIEGNFGYGSNGQLITASKTIYIVPISLLVVIGVALVALLFIIFIMPRMIKGYNRKVVQKATGKK